MLTIAIITRSFASCLQQLHPFEFNQAAIPQGQVGVDFQLDRSELEQTIDDFTYRIIEPAATSLAQALKTRGARYSLPLELQSKQDLSCYRVQYAGCNLRGIIAHNQKVFASGVPIFVEAARFDILWSK